MNKAVDRVTFDIEFECGHFTLTEFDEWVERELNAARTAWLSYGDVFKAENINHSSNIENNNKRIHYIYLSSNNIRTNKNSYYLTVTELNNLRFEGVTELNIDYETRSYTYNAIIPMSDIEVGQNSITITLSYSSFIYGDDSYPNIATKWGSYFKKV